MFRRLVAAVMAAMLLAVALLLANAYPLGAWWALSGALLLAVLVFWQPLWHTTVLLVLLPWLGLMTWTGWLMVEEFDIAVLAVAAGGYARLVLTPQASRLSFAAVRLTEVTRKLRRTSRAWWLLLPLVLSTAFGAVRGVAAAGDFHPGWWHGYQESLNSVRLAKPMLALMLLLPLMRAALRTDGQQTQRQLGWGFVALLAGTAANVWWERLAYTGLLDFSSNYRVSGGYWEAHVGGAALDAALVVSLPFCVVALWRTRHELKFAGMVALLMFCAYAVLATFSRIVYIAVPLGLATAWWMHRRQGHVGKAAHESPSWLTTAAFLLLHVALTAWLFPVAGYRGVLAWLGLVALLLLLVPRVHGLTRDVWLVGTAGGVIGLLVVAAVTTWVSKGAYLIYGLFWLLAMVATLNKPTLATSSAAVAAAMGAAGALVSVTVHWGGEAAWPPGLLAAGAALAVLLVPAISTQAPWHDNRRWQAGMFSGMALSAILVAVFMGGGYMSGRLATSADDGSSRAQHWAKALSWMSAEDWVLGKGLGRYLAAHVSTGAVEDQVGDLRLMSPESTAATPSNRSYVVLTSGKKLMGASGRYRMSQRVGEPTPGNAQLRIRLRNPRPVEVGVELCEKHLIYVARCIQGYRRLPASPDAWQEQRIELSGKHTPQRGWPWAPRHIVFALALADPGQRVEIEELELTDAAAVNLLKNGNFSRGLAHWYITSDHHHKPWHAHNMGVHLLLEQGLPGLLAALLALVAALYRVSVGAARQHALAPPLAGALVGLTVVGAVDSLLHMPRVGFLFWLLLVVALCLPKREPERGRA